MPNFVREEDHIAHPTFENRRDFVSHARASSRPTGVFLKAQRLAVIAALSNASLASGASWRRFRTATWVAQTERC